LVSDKTFLCVYCGSSEKSDEIYKKAAVQLGQRIAQNGYGLAYGGGRLGLMGLVACAVIDGGGPTFGVTTKLLDKREGAQQGLDELHVASTMHERKLKMSEKGDAFIILPGGYGTLDEFFEILTWKQLVIHKKPIIILNINGYWNPLLNLLNNVADSKFASPEHRNMVDVAFGVDDVFKILKKQDL
jgi:uncharacterized protein (TIGR00730 family)